MDELSLKDAFHVRNFNDCKEHHCQLNLHHGGDQSKNKEASFLKCKITFHV